MSHRGYGYQSCFQKYPNLTTPRIRSVSRAMQILSSPDENTNTSSHKMVGYRVLAWYDPPLRAVFSIEESLVAG